MVVRWRTGSTTFAEFLEIMPSDEKADLIDGVIYTVPPENLDHNSIVVWLGTLLYSFVDSKDLGHVTINKVAYRLSPNTAPEPDLAFVKKERISVLKRGYVDGPPDLAVEIVSPESALRDMDLKRSKYEQYGVSEYWLIDPDEEKVTFLVRGDNPDAGYEVAELDGTIFHSRVVAGFFVDTRWLWQNPRPKTLTLVQSMLMK